MMNGLLSDLPQFQDEMQGMQIFNQPAPQEQQRQPSVGFLDKIAMTIVPESYARIQQAKQAPLLAQKAKESQQAMANAASQSPEDLARAAIILLQNGRLAEGEKMMMMAEQQRKLRDKLEFQQLGNRITAVNPYTGQSVNEMSIGISPDSQLSSDTTRRGQDIGALTTRRGQDLAQQRFDAEQEQGRGVGRTKPLNPTEIKLFDESEILANSSRNAVDALTKALEINDKAYFGVFGKPKAVIEGQFGGNEAADATILFENLVSEQALASLKAIFGAAPTMSDVKLLMQLQASVNKPPSQRKQILERALQAAKRKEQEARKRMEALATGQYGTPSYLQDQGSGFKVIGRE